MLAGCGSAPEADAPAVDFAREVEQAEGLVVVDFWAAWCGPCRKIAPYLETLAEEFKGRVKIVKVNVDQHRELSQRFGVRSIPCLIMFRDGKPIGQKIGALSKEAYRAWFNETLGAQDPA
jgi:thioredoxin 1